MQDVLYIVVPCYNEENVLPLTAGTFLQEIRDLIEKKKISDRSRVLFVNDGSTDRTWDVIRALAMEEERYIGISLTRNCGTGRALLAGVREAAVLGADMAAVLECDGQEDVTAVEQMLDSCRSGKHVVYAVPGNVSEEEKMAGRPAQHLLSLAGRAGKELRSERGNCLLLSSRAVQALSLYTEADQDLEGILSLTGLETAEIKTAPRSRAGRKTREKAEMKQRDLIGRIFDLTRIPLRLVSAAGLGAALLSLVSAFVILTAGGGEPWSFPVCLLLFLFGIQLFSMGVIGEYMGRIYMETKKRPGYLIAGRTWDPVPVRREEACPEEEEKTPEEE